MRSVRFLSCLLLALALVPAAAASSGVRFGIQDDAWLQSGDGTLAQRLATLDKLGVDVVRYTVRWDEVAATKPTDARDPTDAAYDWSVPDAVLNGLRAHRIAALVTLYGTPAWARAGGGPNRLPASRTSFADFAAAAATHYSWVRLWTIWNEPNQRIFLVPNSPQQYTQVLLNPAYAAIHQASPGSLVGGGVTSPRGGPTGISPVTWLRAMAKAHARLDAYAQNPYPGNPSETPLGGGCHDCAVYTMANLPDLVRDVGRAFPGRQIWLTEYGYQTNPPDPFLGVSYAKQVLYLAQAAWRVWTTPRVTMLIHFLVRDEPGVARWQSGLQTLGGAAKPAFVGFQLPLVEVRRSGSRVALWGQVRPRGGAQPYRLQLAHGGRWAWVGGVTSTTRSGAFARTVTAGRGDRVRIWSPRDGEFSPPLGLR